MLHWYEQDNVPEGGTSVKCIYAFGHESEMTTWDGARNFCRENLKSNAISGELLSIHSQTENVAIAEVVRASDCSGDINNCDQRQYWIGYRKDCLSCEYQWSDFSVPDFSSWQMNGEHGQHECAYFDFHNLWWQDQGFGLGYFVLRCFQRITRPSK